MPRRLLAILAILACLSLCSCAIGLQQSVLAPGVQGSWAFSGVDRTLVGSGANASTQIPLQLGPDGGTVDRILSPTSLLLALDLPFARLSIAPALLGRDDLELIQFDMLYKHLLIDEPGERWWLLGGLSSVILNSGLSLQQPAHLTGPISVGGHTYDTATTVNYTARRDASAIYAALGAQRELTGWCHAYIELLVRMAESTSHVETAALQSSGSTTDIFPNANGFTSQTVRAGQVNANLELPWVVLTVGVHFNLPSYHFVRRLIRFGAGKAINDQALPADATEATGR